MGLIIWAKVQKVIKYTKTQGGLRNQIVLFYVRTKLSSREHLLFSENEIMSEGSPISNRLQVKTFSRIVATEGFSLAKA